jgi:transcriptional regulator with XRE-family HTH domain
LLAHPVRAVALPELRVRLVGTGEGSAAAGLCEFGAAVQRLRLTAGLSQSELARRTGIDRAYVHRMEKATVDAPVVPSRSVVLAMAAALELGTEDTDALLVAAGYVPDAIVSAGGWRPELALLADFLADQRLSELDRVAFSKVLRDLVVRWRTRK